MATDKTVRQIWQLRADVDLKPLKEIEDLGVSLSNTFKAVQKNLKGFSNDLVDGLDVSVGQMRTLRKELDGLIKNVTNSKGIEGPNSIFSKGVIDRATARLKEYSATLQEILLPYQQLTQSVQKGFKLTGQNKSADQFANLVRQAGVELENQRKISADTIKQAQVKVKTIAKEKTGQQLITSAIREQLQLYVKEGGRGDERNRRLQNSVELEKRVTKELTNQAEGLLRLSGINNTDKDRADAARQLGKQVRELLALADADLRLQQQKTAALKQQEEVAKRIRSATQVSKATAKVSSSAGLDTEQEVRLRAELIKLTRNYVLEDRQVVAIAKEKAKLIQIETAAQRDLNARKREEAAIAKGLDRIGGEQRYNAAASALTRVARAYGLVESEGLKLGPIIDKVAREFQRGEITGGSLADRLLAVSTQSQGAAARLRELSIAQEELNNKQRIAAQAQTRTAVASTQGQGLDGEQQARLYKEVLELSKSLALSQSELNKLASQRASAIKEETSAQRLLNKEVETYRATIAGQEKRSAEAQYNKAADSLFRLAQGYGDVGTKGNAIVPILEKIAKEYQRGELTLSQLDSRYKQVTASAEASASRIAKVAEAQKRLDDLRAFDTGNKVAQQRLVAEEALNKIIANSPELIKRSRDAGVDLNAVRKQAIDNAARLGFNEKQLAADMKRLYDLELRRAASRKAVNDVEQQGLNIEAKKARLDTAARESAVVSALVQRAKAAGLASTAEVNLRQAIEKVTQATLKDNLTKQEQDRLLSSIITKQKSLAEVSARNLTSTNGTDGVSAIGQVIALQQVAIRANTAVSGLIERFSEFEKQLTAVRKTANATTAQMNELGQQLFDIGQTTPVAANDLANIAGILGQVGAISFNSTTNGLKTVEEAAASAVRLVAELTLATDLNAEQAAQAFGQLSAVFARDVERLKIELTALKGTAADTTDALRAITGVLNEISNSTVATVGDLNLFIRNFGGVASAAGISIEAVAALGGAIRDLGVTPQVAGTALSRLFAEFSRKAEVFAGALNITTAEWNALFNSDAEAASQRFFQALGNATKQRQQEILNSIGAEQRLRNTLIKLADGYQLVERNMAIANNTAAAFTSIQIEAGKFSETLDATFSRFSNTIAELAVSFEGFAKFTQALVNALNSVVQALIDGINFLDQFRIGNVSVADVLTGLIGTLVGLAAAIATVAVAWQTLKFAGIIGGFSGATKSISSYSAAIFGAVAASRAQRAAGVATSIALINEIKAIRAKVAATAVARGSVTALIVEEERLTNSLRLQTAELYKNASAQRAGSGALRGLGKAAAGAGAAIGGLFSGVAIAQGIESIAGGDTLSGITSLGFGIAGLAPTLKLATIAFAGLGAVAGVVGFSLAGAAAVGALAVATFTDVGDAAERAAKGESTFADSVAITTNRVLEALKLGNSYTKYLRELNKAQNALFASQALETQQVAELGKLYQAYGATADQAARVMARVRDGSLTLAEAMDGLTITVDKTSGAFTGLELDTTLFGSVQNAAKDVELALESAGKSMADFRLQAEKELGPGADFSRVNERAQGLADTEVAARTSQVRSLVVAGLTAQKKGEEEINKLLKERGESLTDLLRLATEAQIATGFVSDGAGGFIIEEDLKRAEQLRKQLAETTSILEKARALAQANAEKEASFSEAQLTYEQLIADVKDKKIKTLSEALEYERKITEESSFRAAAAATELKSVEALLEAQRSSATTAASELAASRERAKVLEQSANEQGISEEERAVRLEKLRVANEKVDDSSVKTREVAARIGALEALRVSLVEQGTLAIEEQLRAFRELEKVKAEGYKAEAEAVKRGEDQAAANVIAGNELVRKLIEERLASRLSATAKFSTALISIESDLQAELNSIREKNILRGAQLEAAGQEIRLKLLRKVQANIVDLIEQEADRVKDTQQTIIDARQKSLESVEAEARKAEETLQKQLNIAKDYAAQVEAYANARSKLIGSDPATLQNLLGFNTVLADTVDKINETALAAVALGKADAFKDTLVVGLAAIDKEANKAAKSLGILLAQQVGLDERLSKADYIGDRGKAAKDFLAIVQNTASDTSLTEQEREARIAFFQQRLKDMFSSLEGQAPALEDLLTVSEGLAANDGKRVRTAQDVANALQEQLKATQEAKDAEISRASSAEDLKKRQEQINALISEGERLRSENNATSGGASQRSFIQQASVATGERYGFTGSRQDTAALYDKILKDLQGESAKADRGIQQLFGQSPEEAAVFAAEKALADTRDANAARILTLKTEIEGLNTGMTTLQERFASFSDTVGKMNVVSSEQFNQVNADLQKLVNSGGLGLTASAIDITAITELVKRSSEVSNLTGQLADVVTALNKDGLTNRYDVKVASESIINGYKTLREDINESSIQLQALSRAVNGLPGTK